MADQSSLCDKDEQSQVETEFQEILRHIGGKEKIYLVSDASEAENENPGGVLEIFLMDMFSGDSSTSVDPSVTFNNNGNCQIHSDKINDNQFVEENTATSGTDAYLKTMHSDQEHYTSPVEKPKDLGLNQLKRENTEAPERMKGDDHRTRKTIHRFTRIIDSPVIIFIFRQQFLNCSGNKICLKEILKDVRGRTKPAGILPALIGLVYSTAENGETSASIGLLERMIRSVFLKHPPESIWAGHFVPKTAEGILTIKKNACRALKTSLLTGKSVDRRSPLSLLLQCFPWAHQERQMNEAHSISESRHQAYPKDVEEGIPLKTSLATGQKPDCRASEQGSHVNSGS